MRVENRFKLRIEVSCRTIEVAAEMASQAIKESLSHSLEPISVSISPERVEVPGE